MRKTIKKFLILLSWICFRIPNLGIAFDVTIAGTWDAIGKSLFTLFASLACVIQFPMELQMYHFWILKGHTTINYASEYEPDVLNTFCATPVKKLKILQRMYELISAFATQKFCSFWKTISRWILHRKSFNHVLSFTSYLVAWSQYTPNKFYSVWKVVCKWAKM